MERLEKLETKEKHDEHCFSGGCSIITVRAAWFMCVLPRITFLQMVCNKRSLHFYDSDAITNTNVCL